MMQNVEQSENERLETASEQKSIEQKPGRGRPKKELKSLDFEKFSLGCYEFQTKTGEWINLTTLDRESFEAFIREFIALVDPGYPLLWRWVLAMQILSDVELREGAPIRSALERDQILETQTATITKVLQVPTDQEYEIIVRPKNPPNSFAVISEDQPEESDH